MAYTERSYLLAARRPLLPSQVNAARELIGARLGSGSRIMYQRLLRRLLMEELMNPWMSIPLTLLWLRECPTVQHERS